MQTIYDSILCVVENQLVLGQVNLYVLRFKEAGNYIESMVSS